VDSILIFAIGLYSGVLPVLATLETWIPVGVYEITAEVRAVKYCKHVEILFTRAILSFLDL